jgi:RNA polymerase sigma-70 factor (ECF subfamily)
MISSAAHTKLISQKHSNQEAAIQSFSELFEKYRGMLYVIALRILGHGEDAKDAVQETFIRAYINLGTLNDAAAFASWLKSIIKNHCLMELRYRTKRVIMLSKYAKEKEVFADAECNEDEAPEEIKNTLANLSETLQLTSMLRFFSKNSSYNEIASILNIPVGTVRSRLAESRTKLASLIFQQSHSGKNNKAKEMEDFYQSYFPHQYNDPAARNALLGQFDKQVFISFTSGKTVIGSHHVQKQIEFDLECGARATLTEVHSSGNVSILEISNINPPDNHNLCPLSSTFIFMHPKNKIEKAFLHHAMFLPSVE